MEEQEQKIHYITIYFQRLFSSTKGWKDDEFGAYMRLLFEQAETGHIPEDPEEIARLITSYKKNWPRLCKKFKPGEKSGTLQNAFMKEVRDDAVRKITINAENGAKGGRAKKANAIANGIAVAKRPGKRNGSQPVTNNQEPVTNAVTDEESKSVNTRADLSESNLFRKPNVPLWEHVHRVFLQQGGNEVMAKRFFDNNTATSWYHKGSPITNFSNLVPGFIANWKEKEDLKPTQKGDYSYV